MGSRIGLLGGTFNPVHIGHLILANEALWQLRLYKVIFVPSSIPPHKEVKENISANSRLHMLRLALRNEKHFEISTYEIDKGGISYSIDTIKYFQKIYRKAKLFFLTGSDAASNLSTWKDVDKILEAVNFVIATRPGWKSKSPYEKKIRRLVIPSVDVSSSAIRQRLRKGGPIDYLVPSRVVQYIQKKKLYVQT